MKQKKRNQMHAVAGCPGLYKQGLHYRIDFTIGDRRCNKAVGENKELAIDLWQEERSRARRELNCMVDNSLLLKDLWENFVKVKKPEVRPATWESYEHAFKPLWAFFTMPRVRDLAPRHIAEYVAWRRSGGDPTTADATINRELALFKSMLNRGVRDGKIASNPLARVPGVLKPKVKNRRALGDSSIEVQ